MNTRDEIFQNGNGPEKFEFNEQVASAFDDMLERSVPLYRECLDLTVDWCARLAQPDSRIYDLGCSTGSLLSQLADALPEVPGLRLTGVDNSKPMLDKARSTLAGPPCDIELIEADLDGGAAFDNASVVVMNYTLQFIPPERRAGLVDKIFRSLLAGGGFILIEKVLSESDRLASTFVEMHHGFKQDRGYSELEISKKRDALENVLIPWKLSETRALLHKAGFADVDVFFKWNNFAGLVALK
ncbi:hypothetical protein UZ36_02785 [Candidatus Nitromaritima sp. SCGC AAA799-C22]|nr:hypothetical protein UZ36_02785 [Candidatus Nitromaritima sp. SCGC AAA799-C22]